MADDDEPTRTDVRTRWRRRAALVLPAVVVVFAWTWAVVRSRRDAVWILDPRASRSHAPLVVSDTPGGPELPGRWTLVEGLDVADGSALLRLPDAALAPPQAASRAPPTEQVYVATGAVRRLRGEVWQEWTRRDP